MLCKDLGPQWCHLDHPTPREKISKISFKTINSLVREEVKIKTCLVAFWTSLHTSQLDI
jgi:hypothetical protein